MTDNPTNTSYQSLLDWLKQLTNRGSAVFDPDIVQKRSAAWLKFLGNPQDVHPAVHVAATSGKGSICSYIEAGLRVQSKTTGLTLSPHVYDVRERIQINGQMVSEEEFVRIMTPIRAKAEQFLADRKESPSYFEVLLGAAFSAFAEQELDYVVVETGLGGRTDTSNLITRKDKVAVLGKIGFDHTAVLGNTLPQIAAEKAGIIRSHNHVIALNQSEEVNEVFGAQASDQKAEVDWVEEPAEFVDANKAIATSVLRYLAQRNNWKFDEQLAKVGMDSVHLPGRLEHRAYKYQSVILDGAHNPQKLRAIVDYLSKHEPGKRTVILAMCEDKDIRDSLAALKPIAGHLIATSFEHAQDLPKKAVDPGTLAELANSLGIPARVAAQQDEALSQAIDIGKPVLITGSFYLIGEIGPKLETSKTD